MKNKKLAIYQASSGAIELRKDADIQTIWANLEQIANIFNKDKSVISRHIKNIFKEQELQQDSTVAFFATVQKEGNRKIERQIKHFNLDVVISVGYRVNSKIATRFRIWATKTLKEHISEGFTINPSRIKQNQQKFLKAIGDLKLLSQKNKSIKTSDVLDLIQVFSNTWFSLEQYDKDNFPKNGTEQNVEIKAQKLKKGIEKLKQNLMQKNQATEFFAKEKQKDSLKGIIGNVLQAVFGQDVYPTVEEKAANLLYFIVKNHPFIDGNKRSGAFAFIWFLKEIGFSFEKKVSPEALTSLTILIAESKPKDKERMVGLILLILNN